jgi:hypothetical protein
MESRVRRETNAVAEYPQVLAVFSLYHFYRNQSGVLIIQRAGVANKELWRNISWFSGIAQEVDL